MKDAAGFPYAIHILWGTLSTILTVAGVAEWITDWIALLLGLVLMVLYSWHNRSWIKQAIRWIEKKAKAHVRVLLVLLVVVSLALVGLSFRDNIANLIAEHQAGEEAKNLAEQTALNHLRTRPVCNKNCNQMDWLVTDCASRTINAYNNSLIITQTQITNSFRQCLIDNEMLWEPCKYREFNCTHFYYWRDRRDNVLRDRYRLAFKR